MSVGFICCSESMYVWQGSIQVRRGAFVYGETKILVFVCGPVGVDELVDVKDAPSACFSRYRMADKCPHRLKVDLMENRRTPITPYLCLIAKKSLEYKTS